MQITSINQLLNQLYTNIEDDLDIDPKLIEELQQVEQDNTSTLLDMKSDYITSRAFTDENVNAAIIAFALDIEPTAENLLYIKRLGFSMGTNFQKLIKYMHIEDGRALPKEFQDISMAPEEINVLLTDFDKEELIDMDNRLDLLLTLIRDNNGEYIDIPTRLFMESDNPEEIQQYLDQIVENLLELDMNITPENIELVDRLLFVFEHESLDILQVLMHTETEDTESTLKLKEFIEEPERFCDVIIDMLEEQEVYDKIDRPLEQMSRYLKLFPAYERNNILKVFQEELFSVFLYEDIEEELLEFFESNIEAMENSNIRATLIDRIESDIGNIIEFQLKDDFPFWLVPIFTYYQEMPIFGELWINKEAPRHKGLDNPYSLSLWSDFENLGRIEVYIYGIAQNIDVYMLCQPQAGDLITDHREHILDIFKSYDFRIGEFRILEPKSKGSILSYILASSRGIDKNLDIRV